MTDGDRRPKLLMGLFLLLAVVLCSVIFATERPPITRWGYIGIEGFTYRTDYNHSLMGLLALTTAIALVVHSVVRRRGLLVSRRAWRRAGVGACLALVAFGAVLYFYGSRVGKLHYPWFHDSYHYFLGPKYFPELGYQKLYECHLLADSQRPERRYGPSDPVTDLRFDRPSRVRDVEARAECDGFTPLRWDEFASDVTFFDLSMEKRTLRDRGYNGAPLHTFVAGKIANAVPLGYETMLALTFIDIVGILGLLAAVTWAFGWRPGCLFALFFFTNFADRFNFVGASFMRYTWMVCLGIGIAMMHRKRYRAAAILMSAAAMLNVFPLLFFAGVGLKAAGDLWTRRRIAPEHRTFILWALMATLFFGGLSLAQARHVRNYGEFLSAMAHHSGALTHMRVGFKYNFLSRGEIMPSDPEYDYEHKAAELEAMRPVVYPVVGAVLVLGFLVARRLDDVSATIFLGVLLFFMLFGTVTYYFAVAGLLILPWHSNGDSRLGVLVPALMFGLTAAVYGLWYVTDNNLPFLNNTALSAALTVVLFSLLGVYTYRYFRHR